MPRYFFDLHNDMESIDEEGIMLPDEVSALAHAVNEVREMTSASATEHGKIDLDHRIVVRNQEGRTVMTIRFEDAVRFERRGEPV